MLGGKLTCLESGPSAVLTPGQLPDVRGRPGHVWAEGVARASARCRGTLRA